MTRLAFVTVVIALSATAAMAETRRIAIVVGNNAGSGARETLRYAESDAGKMARVFVELGGVAPEQLLLLQGRSRAEVLSALETVRAHVTAAHESANTRALVLFFYSGHSDGEGLEIGRERIAYSLLRTLLQGTGAETRVAIIDACRSGAAIREKGGKPAPAFALRLLDQLESRGEAFLTSSARDEAALESSEVEGSYFTHALVSGLRGAADNSGDGQITLSEIYRYTYDRTVDATALAPAGTQHPVYDFNLAGQGELVLSSLQAASARLVLPAGGERLLITDLQRDQVLAEVLGPAGQELAVAPGRYGVKLLRSGRSFEGRVELKRDERRTLAEGDLKELPLPAAVGTAKGPSEARAASRRPALMAAISYGAAAGLTQGLGVQHHLRLSLATAARGPTVAFSGNTGAGVAAGGTAFTESSLALRAGYAIRLGGERISLGLGLEAGPAWIFQRVAKSTASSLALTAGPRAAVWIRLAGPLRVGLQAEAPAALFVVERRASVGLLPAAGVGIAYGEH